ncbi:hypothetical protein L1049_008074 [Liquidambar formosana]|uniref:Uncharacterized protein n=1 Tax=Liquidambar formosana TaxID=63359 RepID=A0AAP0X816_LIQFO
MKMILILKFIQSLNFSTCRSLKWVHRLLGIDFLLVSHVCKILCAYGGLDNHIQGEGKRSSLIRNLNELYLYPVPSAGYACRKEVLLVSMWDIWWANDGPDGPSNHPE